MFSNRMNQSSLLFGLDDLQEFAFIEKPIRRGLKTAEEIDQLTVDEDLNDVERALYLLSVGQEIQIASVISNLPSLVRQNPAETFHRVVPKVREVLTTAGSEINLAAATSFLTILQDDIILIHTHTYAILKIALLHMDHRDTVVRNAWLDTLLLAVNNLPKETIKQEVLNPLLCQSQLSYSPQARLANCRILAKIASKFDSHILKTELLPMVCMLCQDVDYEVRACMCRQLDGIARGIGFEDTRAELLRELMVLAEDEMRSVRLAAFDTIISMMDMMDSKWDRLDSPLLTKTFAAFTPSRENFRLIQLNSRVHLVVPLLMTVCEMAQQEDKALMASLSFQYGKICNGLAGSMTDEQKSLLLQRFKVLCLTGLQNEGNKPDSNESTLIRCNCGYNMPAMVRFSAAASFLSELYPSFSSLCCDPEISVRRSAAASFHQVVKLLGSKPQLVQKELLALLQDDSLEVLDALMDNLEDSFEVVLSRGEKPALDNKFPELVAILLSVEQKVASSLRWRLHQKLLQRYCCLAQMLPGDALHHRFSTRILTILTTNNVLPVQKEAARTFCTFLRYNRKQEQHQRMMERLIKDLAKGHSYWHRLRFLDVCESAADIFSRDFFNSHFLIPALELVHDPVANVRYKLCQLLPRLRLLLSLPADKQLLQQLDFCVQMLLCSETDKDVVETIQKTVLELDKLDLTEPFHKRQERDLLDEKKEKVENRLIEMEHLERQQSEDKLNSEKHTERKRRDGKTCLPATKSMSASTSGSQFSSSTKEMRKAKLSRSRSLSNQPSTSKCTTSNRSLKTKELIKTSGSGKSSMLPSKDDSLRTSSFTLATQSTSSMPILIRSKTTSLLDRASTHDHRSGTMDHKTSTLDQRDQRDHRTSSLDQRDHRTSTVDQRSKTMGRGHGGKDRESKKLTRKSNSFSVQSGQD